MNPSPLPKGARDEETNIEVAVHVTNLWMTDRENHSSQANNFHDLGTNSMLHRTFNRSKDLPIRVGGIHFFRTQGLDD